MNLLITGAHGLLGSALVKAASESGHTVYGIDRDSLDISDKDAVAAFLPGAPIDVIIHTAAITDSDLCEKDESLCRKVNVDGTNHIVSLAQRLHARLIYISTASVFDGRAGGYREDDIPNPVNVYNISKRLGEEAVLKYEKGSVARINLIGIHEQGSRGKNFFEWLYDAVTLNKDMRLFGDVRINPLSNITLARMLITIAAKPATVRIAHLGSKNVLSKAEIGLFLIKRLGNYTGTIEVASVDGGEHFAKRPKEMWLSTTRTEEAFGLSMPLLEDEIERIVQSRDHDHYRK